MWDVKRRAQPKLLGQALIGGEPPADPVKVLFDLGISILMDAGLSEKESRSLVGKFRKDAKGDEGYNAGSDKYENLVSAGVIDPVKVVRTALQNASSIASLLLMTEALVSEIPEEKKEAGGGGMPGGGGMGGMY